MLSLAVAATHLAMQKDSLSVNNPVTLTKDISAKLVQEGQTNERRNVHHIFVRGTFFC